MDSVTANSPTTASRRPRLRIRRLVLLVVIPLLAGVIGLIVYLKGGRYVATDDAYLKADIVPVSAQVSGMVKKVLVSENQAVTVGQTLYRLDPEPFRLQVAKAEAKLGQVRTELEALRASYREKQAEIAVARTNRAYALREQRRMNDLAQRKFVSAAKLDEVKHNTEVSTQQLNALRQDLRRIARALGGGIDTPIERHPDYLAAAAELNQAKLDLQHSEVRASLAGTVSKLPEPGQYLKAGNTAMVVVANSDLWVEANFSETDLTFVHPGQPVSVRVDTFPGRQWRGVVDSLSPATGAEFAVIPAQNAVGNWVKIVQRVPVRIRIEAKGRLPTLQAGLSSWVEIDTGHHRRLLGFAL
jgi:membrane fusion protein (multidrug efflux system)